jgi:hypothetical protein
MERPVTLAECRRLHNALDILLLDFLGANPEKEASTTMVMELVMWSEERIAEARTAGRIRPHGKTDSKEAQRAPGIDLRGS